MTTTENEHSAESKAAEEFRDVRPVILIDTREQSPLSFKRFPSESAALQTGDYSFRGGEELFAIERKSIPDLVSCCMGKNRERFFRELHRLRGMRFKRLLIVGRREDVEASEYRSRITPNAVLATLGAIEARFDVPVVFGPSPAESAREIERWAYWFARETRKNAAGIPGVSVQRRTPPEVGPVSMSTVRLSSRSV